MPTGATIVAVGRTWINTRYHHGASLKGVGCDCIGVIRGVAREAGLHDPFEDGEALKYAGYGRIPNPVLLMEACDAFMDRVPWATRRLGDVPVFRFAEEPQHFGILSALDPDYVIHAYAQVRKVVENRIDELWASRVVALYRLRGVTS